CDGTRYGSRSRRRTVQKGCARQPRGVLPCGCVHCAALLRDSPAAGARASVMYDDGVSWVIRSRGHKPAQSASILGLQSHVYPQTRRGPPPEGDGPRDVLREVDLGRLPSDHLRVTVAPAPSSAALAASALSFATPSR